MPTLARLWKGGESTTVDLLGEKVVNEAEAQRYADRLIEPDRCVDRRHEGVAGHDQLERDPWGTIPRVDVSVKPTALSPLFSALTGPEALDGASARLRPVLVRARSDAARPCTSTPSTTRPRT